MSANDQQQLLAATPFSRFTARFYLFALMAYILFWPLARSAGAPLLVGLIGIGLVTMLTNRPVPIFWPAMWFSAVSAAYVALSYYDIMPQAWTHVFDRSVIPQQAVGSLALPILIGANICALREIARMSSAGRNRLIAAFVFLGTFATSWLLAGGNIDDESTFLGLLGLNTFFSSDLVLVILLGVLIFRSPPIFAFMAVAFGAAISTNFQPTLVILMALPCRLGWIGRGEALKAAMGILLVASIASGFANELQPLDPNSSIRAAFWHDAIDGYGESHGIGIGYGTEVIRDLYTLAGEDRAIARETDGNFLLVGVHSSFFQTLFRLGTLGVVALIVLVWNLLPRKKDRLPPSPFECWLFLALVTDMAVNVALESINFMPGLVIGMSILLSRIGATIAPAVTMRRLSPAMARGG
jgi:hypothetical protein